MLQLKWVLQEKTWKFIYKDLQSSSRLLAVGIEDSPLFCKSPEWVNRDMSYIQRNEFNHVQKSKNMAVMTGLCGLRINECPSEYTLFLWQIKHCGDGW